MGQINHDQRMFINMQSIIAAVTLKKKKEHWVI